MSKRSPLKEQKYKIHFDKIKDKTIKGKQIKNIE